MPYYPVKDEFTTTAIMAAILTPESYPEFSVKVDRQLLDQKDALQHEDAEIKSGAIISLKKLADGCFDVRQRNSWRGKPSTEVIFRNVASEAISDRAPSI